MGSTFFERYAALCKERNETPNSVAKKIGASSGSVTAWKNGTEPRSSTLAKLANYFGVSTDYLNGNEKTPADNSKRLYELADRNIVRIAGRDGSYSERILTDEQLDLVKALIDQLPEVTDL